MKVRIDPRLPNLKGGEGDYIKELRRSLSEVFTEFALQLNGLSDGLMVNRTSATTAAPTSGTWNKGDFIPNSNPSEAGTAGSKYVIDGWKCVTAGTPGTWVQCRYLTGN